MEVIQPLTKYLLGHWSFTRKFNNGNCGNGIVEFKNKNVNELEYIENGTLVVRDGKLLNASKKYIYMIFNEKLEIYFFENNKSLFQTIKFEKNNRSIHGTGFHKCGKDNYKSKYDFSLDGKFQIKHTVWGPKKNYTSITKFIKQ